MTIELFQHLKGDARKARIQLIREAATPILANNLLSNFTDHSVEHSDEMVRLVDKLVEPIQDGTSHHALSEDELFVLYAACFLHDIGMQYGRAGTTRTFSNLGYGQEWDDLEESTRLSILRDNHHEISAEMVQDSVRSATPPIGIQLIADDRAGDIAALCESHAVDVLETRYDELTKNDGPIRMRVLSALLRQADILEETRRRAISSKERTLSLDLISKVHWWRHRYTKDVVINTRERKITIHFEFPADKNEEYCSIIPALQFPAIREEFERHTEVLNKLNLYYTLSVDTEPRPYPDAEEMPLEVLDEMRRLLSERDSSDSERNRQLALAASSRNCRELIENISNLLQEDRTADELLTEAHALARKLWDSGGHHSACMLLKSAHFKHKAALGQDVRTKLSIELAEWLIKEGLAKDAAQTLGEIKHHIQIQSVDLCDRIKFSSLWARACALACQSEAALAFEDAIKLCQNQSEKSTLEAELFEFHLLQGDIDKVRELGGLNLDPKGRELGTDSYLHIIRAVAVTEGVSAALREIERILESCLDSDRVSVLMLKAELLYLDGDASASLEVFQREIDPLLGDDDVLSLAVADNRNATSLYALSKSYTQEFYALVDERRRRDIALWDADEILRADEAASRNQHYDARPTYWGELVRAYRRGYWRGHWFTSNRMARECLALHLPDEAAFHGMIGMAGKLVGPISDELHQQRDKTVVSKTVSKLIGTGALARHASFVADLLAELSDIIPEENLDLVLNWLLDWAKREGLNPAFVGIPRSSWKALQNISHRLDESSAKKVIDVACSHSAWSIGGQLRKELIVAVNHVIESASVESSEGLIDDSIRFVHDDKSDFDYTEALNLACHLFSKISVACQERMTVALFPPGKGVSDPKMLQVAAAIGKDLGDTAQWSEGARLATDIVRQQVQVLPTGTSPNVVPGSFGTHFARTEPGEPSVVVQMDSGVYLDALKGNRDKVDPEDMGKLISEICKMLCERENSVSNKRILLKALGDFSDVVSESSIGPVMNALESIYSGEFRESTSGMTHKESQDPLNPFKMGMGDPKDLVGISLITAAKYINQSTHLPSEKFETVLSDTLTATDAKMRTYALVAAGEWKAAPKSVLIALIMGTRDHDPQAARMAFDALIWQNSLRLDNSDWKLILFSLKIGVLSDDVELRNIVAASVRKLIDLKLGVEIDSGLYEIQEIARKDICHSVRTKCAEGL